MEDGRWKMKAEEMKERRRHAGSRGRRRQFPRCRKRQAAENEAPPPKVVLCHADCFSPTALLGVPVPPTRPLRPLSILVASPATQEHASEEAAPTT